MSKRKAFNFYNSYYETAKLLSNAERLQFYDAIMEKQFYGIEPTGLKGTVLLVWTSQKHSIDAQVKGWEDKKKESLQCIENHTTLPPSVGATLPPSVQGEEKGKEKEEGKEKGIGDKSPSIQERKENFRTSLIPFLEEFGKETLRAFFDYWTESNEGGKKMRFEMQKVFDRKKRLTNWKAKENDFKKPSEKKSIAIKPKEQNDFINS